MAGGNRRRNTTEDLWPEAINSNPANRRRVGKSTCTCGSAASSPAESLEKDMSNFGLLVVSELVDHLLALSDSTFAEIPRLPSGRCDCPQQREDATMVQRTLTNLGLLEKRIIPMELTGVPEMTLMKSVARSLVRILLLLQAKPTTPRRHCLLRCRNPPVPAPRVCGLAKRLGVQMTRDGIPTAAVSILPPLKNFDPPMYVELDF